jgi:hypothetical protein
MGGFAAAAAAATAFADSAAPLSQRPSSPEVLSRAVGTISFTCKLLTD